MFKSEARLLARCHSGTSLVSTCMELSSGLGWDCVIDGGEVTATECPEAPSRHDVICCLAVNGKWITMVPDLQVRISDGLNQPFAFVGSHPATRPSAQQLDPPDSQLLHWKGASLCFLNEQVWNLSGSQQGRYLHMLFDILCKVVSFGLSLQSLRTDPALSVTASRQDAHPSHCKSSRIHESQDGRHSPSHRRPHSGYA